MKTTAVRSLLIASLTVALDAVAVVLVAVVSSGGGGACVMWYCMCV